MASAYRIGRYTQAERRIRLERYKEKRSNRNYARRVKYSCRKHIADKRHRVQGRFVKRETEAELASRAKQISDTGEQSEGNDEGSLPGSSQTPSRDRQGVDDSDRIANEHEQAEENDSAEERDSDDDDDDDDEQTGCDDPDAGAGSGFVEATQSTPTHERSGRSGLRRTSSCLGRVERPDVNTGDGNSSEATGESTQLLDDRVRLGSSQSLNQGDGAAISAPSAGPAVRPDAPRKLRRHSVQVQSGQPAFLHNTYCSGSETGASGQNSSAPIVAMASTFDAPLSSTVVSQPCTGDGSASAVSGVGTTLAESVEEGIQDGLHSAGVANVALPHVPEESSHQASANGPPADPKS